MLPKCDKTEDMLDQIWQCEFNFRIKNRAFSGVNLALQKTEGIITHVLILPQRGKHQVGMGCTQALENHWIYLSNELSLLRTPLIQTCSTPASTLE